jgi:signal transduction histidine kinase
MLFSGNVFLEDFPAPELPFGHEPLTFEFSSTYYGARDRLYYRWRLDGRDTAWTAWTTQKAAVYRNLPEGEYCFRVEAQNVEGWRGDTAEFHFSVLPPWYRTWWAYLLYVLFAGLLFGTVWLWYQTRFLRRRSEELEQTVKERTAELERKTREIQLQAEELERLDSIVRTVNRETRLPNVLEALLMQSLLFFPQADMALFVRRTTEGSTFCVVESAGRHAAALRSREFTLRDLLGRSTVAMQRMQKGVYQLSGLKDRIAEATGGTVVEQTRFMAMSVLRARSLEGFLVLGSSDPDSFGPADLQRLLRLKEHVSSAVAKASAIEALEHKNAQLDATNQQLINTQEQLVVQKKIAALGELTAGIAHEIQNPLNFVNNFSELSCELLDELGENLAGVTGAEGEEIQQSIALIRSNCDHIRQHGHRATAIVSGMIMHSRSGSSHRDTVALNDLIDEFVVLTFKGMRLQFPQFNLDLRRSYDEKVGTVEVLPQELSRVIVNICNNAWEAAIMRAAEEGDGITPTVQVSSARSADRVRIIIRDNGAGLEPALRERIFEPFFTTKRDNRNAGLGLSMSYDIIHKLHRGELAVRSEQGKYTEFEIMLPAP